MQGKAALPFPDLQSLVSLPGAPPQFLLRVLKGIYAAVGLYLLILLPIDRGRIFFPSCISLQSATDRVAWTTEIRYCSGGWEPKIKVPPGVVSPEVSLLGLQTAPFSLSAHVALSLCSHTPLSRSVHFVDIVSSAAAVSNCEVVAVDGTRSLHEEPLVVCTLFC